MTEECFAPLKKHTQNTFTPFSERIRCFVKIVNFSRIWSRDSPKFSLETQANEFLSCTRVFKNIFWAQNCSQNQIPKPYNLKVSGISWHERWSLDFHPKGRLDSKDDERVLRTIKKTHQKHIYNVFWTKPAFRKNCHVQWQSGSRRTKIFFTNARKMISFLH